MKKRLPVVKKSDCKFYINKEARVIVCVIPNTTYLLDDFLYSVHGIPSIAFTPLDDMLEDWYRLPKSFSGKAVCAEEDEWDEELGKNLAYYRAREKLYNSFFRHARHIINTVDNEIERLLEAFAQLGEKVTDWQDHLEKKIKGEA